MPTPRADLYEKALTELFQAEGYGRVAPRTWARSEDNLIWRGLWITFHNKGSLVAQPALCVFCPTASKIVERGLSNVYGPKVRSGSKLGRPIIVHPLYDRIFCLHGEDRHAFSYDIGSTDEIEAMAGLVHS